MITIFTSNFYYGFLSGIVFTIIVFVVVILWIESQVKKEQAIHEEGEFTNSPLTGSATVDQSHIQNN